MPAHRFIDELSGIEADGFNRDFNVLVVGTFNAAEHDGLNNDALWYYGRKKNEFWYLLPQMLGHQSLHQRENPDTNPNELAEKWKVFCSQNGVVIVDIYKLINGDLPNHGDAAIENPDQYEFFDYQRAFQQVHFNNILFTWKSRTNKNILGRRKEEMHNWFSERGSRILHMITPSYNYRKRKEIKLESWQQLYNAQ